MIKAHFHVNGDYLGYVLPPLIPEHISKGISQLVIQCFFLSSFSHHQTPDGMELAKLYSYLSAQVQVGLHVLILMASNHFNSMSSNEC